MAFHHPSLGHGAATPGCLVFTQTSAVLTFNLLPLISKPLKILINSHKAPGGMFLISECLSRQPINVSFRAPGKDTRLSHLCRPAGKALMEPRSGTTDPEF